MSRKTTGIRWPAWLWPPERPPLPQTQVRYDGALWTVDGSPCLRGTWAANFRRTAVRRRTDTELVLRPTVGAVLFGLVFTGIGIGVLATFIRLGIDHMLANGDDLLSWPFVGKVLALAIGCLLGVFCVLMSLRIVSQIVHLDRTAGTMTVRTLFGTDRQTPLADVVAVQAIYAGRLHGGSRGGGSHDMFQVNLIVAVGDKKVNVVSEPNEAYVRGLATDLAAFLGVPLVDQVEGTLAHHGRRRLSAGTGIRGG